MITASLLRRRSRMLIALLSIGIGATILAGLVTIYVDVPRQMGAQFRSYGANMLLLPVDGETLDSESLAEALQVIPADALVGAAPYRYVRLDMTTRQQSFTAAGTDFSQIIKTSPYFSVEGAYPSETRQVLVGREIAETIGVKAGSTMELTYQPTASSSEKTPEESRVPGASLSGKAEGFGGGVVYVSAILDDEAKIASLTVDASTQTPEYGGRIPEDEAFLNQFVGRSLPLAVGEGIDALTGATVTSAAVVDALNQAAEAPVAARPRTMNFTVTGILTTGGEEEGYVFLSLQDMEAMTGTDQLDVAELSVTVDLYSPSHYNRGTRLLLSQYLIYLKRGAQFDPWAYVAGMEKYEEAIPLDRRLVRISNPVDTSYPGVYEVLYTVMEEESENTTQIRLVVIVE